MSELDGETFWYIPKPGAEPIPLVRADQPNVTREALAAAFGVLTDNGRLTLTGDSMKEWLDYADTILAELRKGAIG